MIDWCIVGCGWVADLRIAPGLRKSRLNRLAAVVSRDKAKAAAFAAKHGAEQSFDSFDAMLKDPDIDAVYIGTPNALHASQTISACRAGKHVFCEKPLALTVQDCEAMVEAATDHGVKLGVGFDQRFNPPHREAKRRIQAGMIGDVVFAMKHWGYVSTWRKGWRLEPELAGGGAVVDSGVHGIDLLRFLVGREVTQVGALLDTAKYGWPLDEVLSAVLEFEGGAHGFLNVGAKYPYPRVGLEIYGSAGSIFLVDTVLSQMVEQPPPPGHLEMVTAGGTERLDFPTEDIFQGELDAFATAIVRDTEPEASGLDGLRVQAVAVAIQESARFGKTIRLR